MDVPILGTLDLSPSGLFLSFATLLALVYFGYQIFGTGRAGRNAKEADETPQVEPGDTAADDDAAGPTAESDTEDRPQA